MPSKIQRAKRAVDAIREIVDQNVQVVSRAAEVVGVNANGLRIRIRGNARVQDAIPLIGVNAEQGDRVLVLRGDEDFPWYVLGVVAGSSLGYTGGKAGDQARGIIAPPANLAANGQYNAVYVTWTAPLHVQVHFEIQHNSSATEVGSVSSFVDGTSFIWIGTATRYFRVRTITYEGSSFMMRASSWSAWVNATPTDLVNVINLTDLADVNEGAGFADGQAPVWNDVAGAFIPGATSGGSAGQTLINSILVDDNGAVITAGGYVLTDDSAGE